MTSSAPAYAVRYWSINATDADPSDESSWTEYIHVVESLLEMHDLYDQWVEVYADNPSIRNIEMVTAPPITWTRYVDPPSPGS